MFVILRKNLVDSKPPVSLFNIADNSPFVRHWILVVDMFAMVVDVLSQSACGNIMTDFPVVLGKDGRTDGQTNRQTNRQTDTMSHFNDQTEVYLDQYLPYLES